mmetsp:Transcript_14856/g.16802  ORF Transcript_14856/g.16802 Transcript_14856/m.16802 type:complete len:202 (+) Transcript_14856:95-700(+)
MSASSSSLEAGKNVLEVALAQVELVQEEWKEYTSEGLRAATSLSNNFIHCGYLSGRSWGVLQQQSDIQFMVHSKTKLRRIDDVTKLRQSESNLVEAEKRMNGFLQSLREAVSSSTAKCGNDYLPVLTKTCTIKDVCGYIQEISTMLQDDLRVKKAVVADLSMREHVDRQELLCYLSAWSSSPLIDEDRMDEICRILKAEIL